MALLGIGVDVVDIKRVEGAYRRFGDRMLNRFFTEGERVRSFSRARPMEHLAVCLATKEAFFKACRGVCKLRWREIELGGDNYDLPVVVLHGSAKNIAEKSGIKNIFVSITHEGGIGVSVVVLEG
mgnify:CR=1 FL=1